MKQYVVFAAIDSWHLANGVHCPNNFGHFSGVRFYSIEDCYMAVREYGEKHGYRMNIEISNDKLYSEFKADGREGIIMIYELNNN